MIFEWNKFCRENLNIFFVIVTYFTKFYTSVGHVVSISFLIWHDDWKIQIVYEKRLVEQMFNIYLSLSPIWMLALFMGSFRACFDWIMNGNLFWIWVLVLVMFSEVFGQHFSLGYFRMSRWTDAISAKNPREMGLDLNCRQLVIFV